MKNILGYAGKSAFLIAGLLLVLPPAEAGAADATSTVAALRMNANITGGLMPTSNAAFQTMVTDIAAGDYFDAAMAAINTPYFAKYLGRQMAKEMQNPSVIVPQKALVPDERGTGQDCQTAPAYVYAQDLHSINAR